MHKHVFFVGFIGAFLCGIVVAVFVPQWAWLVASLCGVCALFYILFAPRFYIGLYVGVLIIGCFIGVARGKSAYESAHAPRIYDNTSVTVYGVVLNDPVESAYSKRAIIGVRSCSTGQHAPICAVDKILVRTHLYENTLSARSGVKFSCTLKRIKNFTQDFDYIMYLAAKGVFYECVPSDIVAWESTRLSDRFHALLARVRLHFERVITHNVAHPQAALAAGLLFGGDKRLSEAWQDNFSATGLTHIVAVSGYNVTVITHALILFGIFCGLWRWQALWLALVGVVIFVLMIGAPTPAVRAGIMGIIVLLLMYSGRVSAAFSSLLLSAAIMLFVNPLLVRYDIGFQLSFLATCGIITIYPLFERINIRRNAAFGMWDIIFATVSAQLLVVPIIAYHFHVFTPLSLIANVLVLPLIPVAMALTSGMLLASMLSPLITLWSGWFISILLAWVFGVVHFFAHVPYAQIKIETVPPFLLVLWYGGMSIFILLDRCNQYKCTHKERKNICEKV